MRKGVILEVNDRYVTLLTPEGEFLQTRKLKQTYEIGEEIHFFPIQAGKRKHLKLWTGFKGKMTVLVSSIVLAVFAFAPNFENRQVYAYMTIDVNPSIELGLNDQLEVISAEPYNKEGERVLSSLEKWKGKDAAQVAEQVLEEIEQQGYLKKEDSVLIATVHTDESRESIEKELIAAVTEIKESGEREELEFTVLTGTAKERETALKEGVTTGVFKEKTQTKTKPDPSKRDAKVPAEVKQPARNSTIQKAEDSTESPSNIKQNKETLGEKKDNDSSPSQNKGKQTEKKAVVRKVQEEKTKDQVKSQNGAIKPAPTANPQPQVPVKKPVQSQKNNNAGQQEKKTPSANKPGKPANNNSSKPSVKENNNSSDGKPEKQKRDKVDNKEKKNHTQSVPKEHPNKK